MSIYEQEGEAEFDKAKEVGAGIEKEKESTCV
jgi:hypothetical protein